MRKARISPKRHATTKKPAHRRMSQQSNKPRYTDEHHERNLTTKQSSRTRTTVAAKKRPAANLTFCLQANVSSLQDVGHNAINLICDGLCPRTIAFVRQSTRKLCRAAPCAWHARVGSGSRLAIEVFAGVRAAPNVVEMLRKLQSQIQWMARLAPIHSLKIDLDCASIDPLSLLALAGKTGTALLVLDIGRCLHVNDCGLISLVAGCPNIQCLNLRETASLDEQASVTPLGARHIASMCKLRALNLTECRWVNKVVLENMMPALVNLQVLVMPAAGDDCLATFDPLKVLSKLTNLKDLNLLGCGALSNAGLLAFVNGCRNLRRLLLGADAGYSDHNPLATLTAQGLCCLAECDHLAHLALNGIDGKATPCLALFAKALASRQRSTMRVLDLKETLVQDMDIKAICDICLQLQVLHLSGCSNISDSSIHHISAIPMPLKALSLPGAVTDSSIASISHGAFHLTLEELQVGWPETAQHLTDASLKALMRCPKLRYLCVGFGENSGDGPIFSNRVEKKLKFPVESMPPHDQSLLDNDLWPDDNDYWIMPSAFTFD